MDQAARGQSIQLPSALLAKQFGKIYLRPDGERVHVEFTIWLPELEGSKAERWQTGVALDASASMKDWYGRNLSGAIPLTVQTEYEAKGWIQTNTYDGCAVRTFTKHAYEDAIQRGYVKFTDNIVEPLARDFISYLARELDSDGGTTVIYWACGDGGAFEVVGDYTEAQCASFQIRGPKSVSFGEHTKLTPALKYFVDRFTDAPQGIYVFLTDGMLDDLDTLKTYTTQLARDIESGIRKPIKCVLIGVGDKFDEAQMTELDDLDTGADVDIWDHKIARDLRDVSEIIVELVDENKVVAPTAVVYDSAGQIAFKFSDGLTVRGSFSLPAHSTFFELEVAGQRIRQNIVMPRSS